MRAPNGVIAARAPAARRRAASTVSMPIAASWRSTYAFAMGQRNWLTRNWGTGRPPASPLAAMLLAATLLFGLLPAAQAGETQAGDAARGDRPAALLAGFRIAPPYVIRRPDGSLTGLEFELAMAAAAAAGLSFEPDILPFGRLPEDFRRGRLDAFTPAGPGMQLPGCLSDTLLVYQNVAFTLARDRLPIDDIHDLAYYDVTAFQNASRLLGPAMRQVRQINTRYHEVANQMLQVRALFSGRTDVVVADRRIFRFLMHSADAGIDTSAPLDEHALFPASPYSVAFRDAAACAGFNDGLQHIHRDGRYTAIMQKWEAALQAAGVTPIRFRPAWQPG
jgi:polar amino acid transport system substrate-binding protein